MNDITSNVYDMVQYPSYPLPQTHPDRLAVLATLYGMKPAPAKRCRVLELGCGEGGNLISMAFGLPESDFVGIDLAVGPIAKGQEIASSWGITNLKLECLDILEISSELGKFDYIIAHGVYSWVPQQVREKLLAVCQAFLAPQGIAYISYNTFPGGHFRQMIREMMLFHAGDIAEPHQQMENSLDFLSFLAESQIGSGTYGLVLKNELERINAYSDKASLFHDDLSEANAPVYFYQFVNHAAQHGLQFLAEADFFQMQDHSYASGVREKLSEMSGGELLVKEQYLDFLKGRRFRQTLLCHQDCDLDRTLSPDKVSLFSIASSARTVSPNMEAASDSMVEFRGSRGAVMKINHKLSKAAFCILGEIWPVAVPFTTLAVRAFSTLGRELEPSESASDPEVCILAEILLGAYSAGLVDFHLPAPNCSSDAGERPIVSPLARLQAGIGHSMLSSLLHTNVQIEDELGLQLIMLLDGTRDRAAIIDELSEQAASGELMLHETNGTLSTSDQAREMISRELDQKLKALARLGMLVE